MEPISKLLQFKAKTKFKKHKTNKFYLIAEDIAKITKTKPLRWIREVKRHEWAVNRSIIEYKEAKNIRKPIALFQYLLKKNKRQSA